MKTADKPMSLANARLVDMKLSKRDKKESMESKITEDRPSYPWGLRLNLDDDSLKKLGISLPDVGESMRVTATATVVSVSENKHEHGSHNRHVELQIVKMGLKPAKEA